MLIFLAVAGFLLLFAILWWVGHELEKKRRAALSAAAAQLHLEYCHETDHSLHHTFDFLRCMNKGDRRYSRHHLHEIYHDHPVRIFEYHYQTTSRSEKSSSTTHYYFSVFALSLPVDLESLTVTPENFLTRAASAIGFSDIELESAEFNRRFRVSAKEKRFAYDVLHPLMMEMLLLQEPFSLEMAGPLLCIVDEKQLAPELLQPRLDLLVEIRSALPHYLLERK